MKQICIKKVIWVVMFALIATGVFADWIHFDAKGNISKNKVDKLIKPTIKLHQKKQDCIQLSVKLTSIKMRKKKYQSDEYTLPDIDGWAHQGEVGKPALPIKYLASISVQDLSSHIKQMEILPDGIVIGMVY